LPKGRPTTGLPALDNLLGEIQLGDNVVWEVDSGAQADRFVSRFIEAAADEGSTLVYVSFNRSPQSIVSRYMASMSPGSSAPT